MGALYQYIPLAGAGSTLGAVAGSGIAGSRLGGCLDLLYAEVAAVAEDDSEDIFAEVRGVATLRCRLDADGVVVLEPGVFTVLVVDEVLSERATGW